MPSIIYSKEIDASLLIGSKGSGTLTNTGPPDLSLLF